MVKTKKLETREGLYPNAFCKAGGNISNDSGCEGLTAVAVHLQ